MFEEKIVIKIHRPERWLSIAHVNNFEAQAARADHAELELLWVLISKAQQGNKKALKTLLKIQRNK